MTLQVLVVDDDRGVRIGLLRLLRARGYVVEGVRNGKEAMTLALKSRPDVILMDVVMRRGDGIEAARELKRHPLLAAIPIIVLTASPDLARPAAAFHAVLTKPCPSEELFRTIETSRRA